MTGYAQLKGGDDSVTCVTCVRRVTAKFDALKFEVALGIAKRVETKAAALLAVWAIILAAAATTIAAAARDNFMPIAIAIAFLVVFPVLALVRIFRQLDNRDIEWDSICRERTKRKLYDDIISDLVFKEACYRFAYEVTFMLLSFCVLSVILVFIDPPELKP